MPNKAIAAADGHKIHRYPSIYIELENTCVRPFEVWCSEKAREEHLDQPYQLLFDSEIRLLAEDADHLSIPNHHLASEVTGHPDLQLGLELLQCRSCWCYEQSFSEFTNIKRDVRHVVMIFDTCPRVTSEEQFSFCQGSPASKEMHAHLGSSKNSGHLRRYARSDVRSVT
jgi:hypothetical protein